MHFFSVGIRCVLSAAFVIVCLVQAKKLGIAGAIMLAAVAVLDVSIVLGYFLLSLAEVESRGIYTMLDILNVLFNLLSTALIVGAMVTLRSKTAVRG